MGDQASLPWLDIDSEAYLADPHSVYRGLRLSGWAARSKRGIELLHYGQIHELLRDRRLYWPMLRMLELGGITEGPVYDYRSRALIALEGDDHARMRRLALLGFNRRVVDDKRAGFRAIGKELFDQVEERVLDGDEIDFNTEIAQVLPSRFFCLLMGAPIEDAPLLARWSVNLNQMVRMDASLRPTVEQACVELTEYARELIVERRRNPGNDVLSELLGIEAEGDRLSRDELVILVLNILMASTDTTSGQTSLTVGALCDNPDQWALVHANPDLAGQAVEEGLRFAPRQLSTLRVSDEDITVSNGEETVEVRAGTMFVLCVSSANRDSAVFADPDRFELRRPDARAQLSFGAGVHGCLGQMVARMEMEEVLREMATRFSTIERSAEATVNPGGGHAVEVDHLPVRMAR